MEPPHSALEASPGPGGSIAILLRSLEHAATSAAFAVVLGVIAARVMRRQGLHWSWAFPAVFAAVLAGAFGPGARTALLLAAGWAALDGRRRHRRDLEAGGDLAELAAARLRPQDVLVALRCRLAERTRGPGGRSGEEQGAALVLGRDERGRAVSVPLGGREGSHVLVVGATGSGKTVTQSWIAANAIARGLAAIVVDPKGDAGLREEIRRAALAAARPFIAWSPHGEAVYNPLARGQRNRDRRPGARGRALHRAALPPPGPALPRARRPRDARGRGAGEPAHPRRAPRDPAPRAARADAARPPRRCDPRISRRAHPAPAGRAHRGARSARDPRRVRRRTLAGPASSRHATGARAGGA